MVTTIINTVLYTWKVLREWILNVIGTQKKVIMGKDGS